MFAFRVVARSRIVARQGYGQNSFRVTNRTRAGTGMFLNQRALFHQSCVRRATIEERVQKIIVEQLGFKESDVNNMSSFVEDLGADSLDIVELVMAIEEEFDAEIPDEEAEKMKTVQNIIDYVKASTP